MICVFTGTVKQKNKEPARDVRDVEGSQQLAEQQTVDNKDSAVPASAEGPGAAERTASEAPPGSKALSHKAPSSGQLLFLIPASVVNIDADGNCKFYAALVLSCGRSCRLSSSRHRQQCHFIIVTTGETAV